MTHPDLPHEPQPRRTRAWNRWLLLVIPVAFAALLSRASRLDREATYDDDAVVVDVRDANHADAVRVAAVAPAAGPPATPDAPPAPVDATRGATVSTTASGVRALRVSHSLAPGSRLRLEADLGDVTLVAASDATAVVSANVSGPDASEWRLETVAANDEVLHLRLLGKPASRSGGWLARLGAFDFDMNAIDSEVSVRVEVPTGVHVAVETAAGDVDARAIDALLDVETGAGDVEVAGPEGDVRVGTGAGDVVVRDARSDVQVESGAGDVIVERVMGRVDVDTGAGDISVREATSELDLSSGAGSIGVSLAQVGDRVSAETGMGSISLRVRSGGFRLDAESGVGSVELASATERVSSNSLGSSLHRTIGDGGPLVALRSGAGSIDVMVGAPALQAH